ncbi:TspO protein [Candidatus Micrarchaeota archaeon CG10_big_fil_rev_8_21_14_0_10_45_29]|nr:MAG: TspO protein [Candidatus Micrarchaeota archaeon CG10_big_fil_rev_8_21_14_0_10_45_29]
MQKHARLGRKGCALGEISKKLFPVKKRKSAWPGAKAKIDWLKLAGFVAVCELAGVVGSIFTNSSSSAWYASLSKPFFTPAAWLFAPVWISLYAIMGIAAYLVFQKEGKQGDILGALKIFAVQLMLNALWSIMFFGMRSLLYSLICIIALWFFILLCIWKFYKVKKEAAYLMLPYLLWVSFAALLNMVLWMLNMHS